MLQSHFKYMRLESDEELEVPKHEDMVQFLTHIHKYYSVDLTKSSEKLLQQLKTFEHMCNLIFWYDGSTHSSHGYILIMEATLYNDAVFMANEEYFQLTSISTQIHSIIEKPYLYILTQPPSTKQQLIYSEEHLTDILSFKDSLTTKDGITIFDLVGHFTMIILPFNMKLDSRRVVTMLVIFVTLIQTAIKTKVHFQMEIFVTQRMNQKCFAYSFILKPIKNLLSNSLIL